MRPIVLIENNFKFVFRNLSKYFAEPIGVFSYKHLDRFIYTGDFLPHFTAETKLLQNAI